MVFVWLASLGTSLGDPHTALGNINQADCGTGEEDSIDDGIIIREHNGPWNPTALPYHAA